MAPKAAVKRPAAVTVAAVTKAPAAKVPRKDKAPKAAADPLDLKCQLVEAALQEASGVPEEVLSLLVSSLGVLRVVKDERHKFQAAFVGMMEEVLRDLETKRAEAAEQALAAAATAGAGKVSAEAATREADKAFAEMQETAAARTTEESDCKSELDQAVDALAAAQAAQATGDAELEAAGGRKAALEALRSETFAPLRDWTVASEKEAKSKVSELVAFGKEHGLDASLLGILPKAFKEPSSRSAFDSVGVQQLEAELGNYAARLATTIEEGEPAKAARERVVREAQAACEKAGQQHDTAVDALAEAEAMVTGSKKAAAAAAQALKEAVVGLAAADSAAGAAEAELARYRGETLAAFLELRDLAPPPLVEEKPEEVAAEAEPADAEVHAGSAPMETAADQGTVPTAP